jgi:hypothetical protein
VRIEKISILTIKEKARTNKVVSTEVNFYIHKNLFPWSAFENHCVMRELPAGEEEECGKILSIYPLTQSS